jgi:hypothetical protein
MKDFLLVRKGRKLYERSENVNNGSYIFSGQGIFEVSDGFSLKVFGVNIGSEIQWDVLLLHQPAGKLVLWVRRAHTRFSTLREL